MLKPLEIYYTYIYYDPSRGNEPIYVGKGKGGRAWDHLKRHEKHPFVQRLQYMKKNGVAPIIGIYAGLDEEFALFLEEELISLFGRKSLGAGPLLNLSSGGESSASGATWKLSDEAKQRMRKSHAGKCGIPHTEEAKTKITKSLIGRKHSEETKAKIAAGNKGKKKPIS